MTSIRDKVWTVLASKRELTERVDALVDLLNEEKARSYGIGYHDGTRKVAPFIGR
jgi:hypothetical protein